MDKAASDSAKNTFGTTRVPMMAMHANRVPPGMQRNWKLLQEEWNLTNETKKQFAIRKGIPITTAATRLTEYKRTAYRETIKGANSITGHITAVARVQDTLGGYFTKTDGLIEMCCEDIGVRAITVHPAIMQILNELLSDELRKRVTDEIRALGAVTRNPMDPGEAGRLMLKAIELQHTTMGEGSTALSRQVELIMGRFADIILAKVNEAKARNVIRGEVLTAFCKMVDDARDEVLKILLGELPSAPIAPIQAASANIIEVEPTCLLAAPDPQPEG